MSSKHSEFKVLFYSVNVNNYDYIFPDHIKKLFPACSVRYVCIDCYSRKKNSISLRRSDIGVDGFSSYLCSRYIKLQIYKIIPGYDYYFYVDANVVLKINFRYLFKDFLESKKIFFSKLHPERSTLRDEFDALLLGNKIIDRNQKMKISKQRNSIDNCALNAPLYENNVFGFRNCKVSRQYFDYWFRDVKKWQTRDQLSNPQLLKAINEKYIFQWRESYAGEYLNINGHKNNNFPDCIYNWLHCRRHIKVFYALERVTRPAYYFLLWLRKFKQK